MSEPVVRVRLLGPFEVLRDGAPVPLARRPALLLAVLALRLDVPVSYGAITDLLWSDKELPADSRRAIQTYASRVRDVLGREAIVGYGDGLRLTLDPDQVDLYRFRRLVSGPAPSATAELAALTEALDLCTGVPLSNLTAEPLAEAEAAALLDEVLGVAERRNELRLQIGDTDEDFVASLRRLTTQHPWRERTWCHLMLALYRVGRQGEALATFTRLVAVLRDDLGIDPGVEATQLHQRMLAGDPDLLAPAPARPRGSAGAPVAGAPGADPPAQLPAGSPAFVGRRRELSTLAALLDRPADRVRVAVVSGPAGVGKTTTVVEAAHRSRDRFPDGQLYAVGTSGGAAVPARDILGAFLRDLGTTPDDIPASLVDRAALFRSVCARRRLLIVVDDAHSVEQVTDLLPGAGECAVLVTTRRRLAVPANVSVDLDVITDAESHQLLATLTGADRLASDPEAAAAIVATCAGSPLALTIVGGRLASRPNWPLAHLRDRLAGPGRLSELRLDGRSVAAVLDATTGMIDPHDESRFRALGALPADFADVESAAALWDVGRTEARDLLERLCDVRLLESAAPDCYRWHGLIGSYLREDPRDHDPAGTRRALREALTSLANARDCLRPGDRPHPPAVVAVVESGETTGVTFAERDDVHAWVHPRGALLIGLALTGLASDDDERTVEAAAMAILLDSVMSDCCGADDTTVDLLRALTETELPAGAGYFVTAAWHNLAATLSDQDLLTPAQEAFEKAVAGWRRLGDRYGEAALLNNLGLLHDQRGAYTTAVDVMGRCMAIADALPELIRVRCLRTFAYLLARNGDAAGALAQVSAARNLHLAEPGTIDAYSEAKVMAYAHLAAGEPELAIAAAEAAQATARQIRSTRLAARAAVVLARARRLTDQSSREAAAEALQLLTGPVHHDTQTRCEALAELAHAHRSAGDHVSAEACIGEVARLVAHSAFAGTPWADALLAEFGPAIETHR